MEYNHESLINMLMPYTENEQLAKKFYDLYGKAKEYSEYYSTLSDDQRNQINVKEYMTGLKFLVFGEQFFSNDENNVEIIRHKRYDPVVEHSHLFYEMIFVFSGTCTNIINDQKYLMHSGDLCLLPPGTPHSVGIFDDSLMVNAIIRKDFFTSYINFALENGEISEELYDNLQYNKQSDFFIMLHCQNEPVLTNMIDSITWTLFQNEGTASAASVKEGIALTILKYIFGNLDRIPFIDSSEEEKELTSDIISFVKENYKSITLRDISEKFHYTEQYMSRIIHRETGKTLMELLTETKIQKACELLISTDMKIIDICMEVGYDSQEHFYRVFKNSVGLTPQTYKKNYM